MLIVVVVMIVVRNDKVTSGWMKDLYIIGMDEINFKNSRIKNCTENKNNN